MDDLHLEQLRVECIKDREQVLPLEKEWDSLHRDSTNPSFYNSFDFIYSALVYLLENEADMRLFLVRKVESNEIVAFFPFEETTFRWYFFKAIAIEYTALQEADKPFPVIKDGFSDSAWRALFLYFKVTSRNWHAINLLELEEASYETSLLPKLCNEFGFQSTLSQCREGPIISLERDWDEFSSAHPKMRKKIRAMERDYGERLSFQIIDEDWEKGFELYTALEQKSWKKGQVGITKNPTSNEFHRYLFERCGKKRKIIFGFLMVDKVTVSAEIAYCQDDKVFFSHGCYDEDFKKYSPGMVSTSLFLKHFFASPYMYGDFLSGFASYLNAWSDKILKTQHIEILNTGTFTRAIRIARFLKRKLKQMIELSPLSNRG
ncbi:hypothetical protein NBRC116493_14760 [Aurantivibrio infirmus]